MKVSTVKLSTFVRVIIISYYNFIRKVNGILKCLVTSSIGIRHPKTNTHHRAGIPTHPASHEQSLSTTGNKLRQPQTAKATVEFCGSKRVFKRGPPQKRVGTHAHAAAGIKQLELMHRR